MAGRFRAAKWQDLHSGQLLSHGQLLALTSCVQIQRCVIDASCETGMGCARIMACPPRLSWQRIMQRRARSLKLSFPLKAEKLRKAVR